MIVTIDHVDGMFGPEMVWAIDRKRRWWMLEIPGASENIGKKYNIAVAADGINVWDCKLVEE